ncbi:probable serine/threonine-protein kinase DDB_G0277165 [Copidosoma floridanum]|uniref:probable serine/threonine-protein kinase DDB_G0277165 n=1 Tax=Copidosoma floridanum TaxID=29053 RepID=UPI0006C9C1A5|nr:probable serine/threonine-protein kinase DDB_G0277165 [Copidosoma floridanum]
MLSSNNAECITLLAASVSVESMETSGIRNASSEPIVVNNDMNVRLNQSVEKSAVESPNQHVCDKSKQSLVLKKSQKENNDLSDIEVPKPGTLVPPKIVKKAGPYILGPIMGSSPVKSIIQCLARREGTDKFYTMKILTLKDSMQHETQDDRQGKMLLHSEYSLLSLLQNQDGVVHHHGFFKDCALEEEVTSSGNSVYTGKTRQRLCLVLDYLACHEFSGDEFIILQHYVIREKKLTEKESLFIFFDTVRIVACLHEKNVVHRDLKLGNLVLNRQTRKVTITNFCLGKHLASESDLLKDQRGSPAYISPDVLCGKPYLGKPSDMWALGVVLYTMLYGQFPFYDSNPTQLFNKIKAANYCLPADGRISDATVSLIKNLLNLQPSKRFTAIQVLDKLSLIISTFKVPAPIGEEEDQVVPDIDYRISSKIARKGISELCREAFVNPSESKNLDVNEEVTNDKPSALAPQHKPYNQIPVYRIDSDARELTAEELNKYKHLIPRESQRQHPYNPNNRNDGSATRMRSCLRTRNSGGNHINAQAGDYSVNQRPQSSNDGSGASSSSSTNSGNANSSNLGRFLQATVPMSSQMIQRQAYVANNVMDVPLTSSRPSRVTFNDVPMIAEYNRHSNLSAVVNRNQMSSAPNYRPWLPMDIQENQLAPTAAENPDINTNSNLALRLNNRSLIASQGEASVPVNGSSSNSVGASDVVNNGSLTQPQHPHNRTRHGTPDWLPQSFLRQQNRIDSMERAILARRITYLHNLGHIRHNPYVSNYRQLDSSNLLGQPSSVRRVHSDSSLSSRSLQINTDVRNNNNNISNEPNINGNAERDPLSSTRQMTPTENLLRRVVMFNEGNAIRGLGSHGVSVLTTSSSSSTSSSLSLASSSSLVSNEASTDTNAFRRNIHNHLLTSLMAQEQLNNNRNNNSTSNNDRLDMQS